jgi:UDP-glucose 4-epimerase
VIGGGGYIGTFLVPLLVATGRHVTVLGRRPAGSTLPNGARYVQGCFSDQALIRRLLDENREAIHLAYATVPNTSFDNPLGDLIENLPPSVQLFAEAALRGNRLVLVSSGGTVYGEANALPITEDHPTRPISPYGVTKLTLERYAHLYGAIHGLQVICLRPGNAYGEGQRPFMGQGFIATAIASAITSKPITIFGERGGIRDYIHVSDLAGGIVKALDYGEAGQVYNLGTGEGFSNMDVISRLSPLLARHGYSFEISIQKVRKFDVRANVLDSKPLQIKTGWLPRVTFETGLESTINWLLDYYRSNEKK